jgi:hypothetical protein
MDIGALSQVINWGSVRVLPFSLFMLGLLERAWPQVVEAVPGAVGPVDEVPTPAVPSG